MTDPNDTVYDLEGMLEEPYLGHEALDEFEADEQLAADLLADEEAEAQRFDDLNRYEPRWAFLP